MSESFQRNGKFVQFLKIVHRRQKRSIQAPQHRKLALISDSLELENLSIREEALLATNWINDRPEELKLQNVALATIPGPAILAQVQAQVLRGYGFA